MREAQTFTLEEVQQQLQRLDIPFSTSSSAAPETRYAFKSLRQIESAGIYFLLAGIPNPPQIENSIILYPEGDDGGAGNVTLQVEDPQLVFYRLMEAMVGEHEKPQGIHPTAVIGEGCEIDPSAYIGPFCVLEDCIVKAGTRLHSHVTIMRGTTIEEDVTIESHSTIGATGVAWIWEPATRRRVVQPQTGYTRVCRGSFLGSDITVVRGSVNETTIIGDGCVIAHGSKIGHGSQIGPECHFANNISIAGNVTLGQQCFLGSGAVVRPQTRLAERTVVGAGAVVVKHCEEPGLLLMGAPAKPAKSASGRMSGVPKPLDNYGSGMTNFSIVSEKANIAEGVTIGRFCIIEDDVQIAAGAVIEDYAMVLQGAKIGRNTKIGTYTKVGKNVVIGADCSFTSYCEIRDNCQLGDHVIMGSRGTLSANTIVEDDVVMKYAFVVTDTPDLTKNDEKSVGRLKKGSRFGASVVIMPGVTIGENAEIGACSQVRKDVPDNQVWFGMPAKYYRDA